MTITPEEIARLREIEKAATLDLVAGTEMYSSCCEADRNLIAAARNALVPLMDEVERWRALTTDLPDVSRDGLLAVGAELIRLRAENERLKDDKAALIESTGGTERTNALLRSQLATAREALRSCVAGTHMWVIREETARECEQAFSYIRGKANAALEKLGEK